MDKLPLGIVTVGCQLTWNGLTWVETVNNCGGGACAVPARDGKFIGETVNTPCLDLDDTEEEARGIGGRTGRGVRPRR